MARSPKAPIGLRIFLAAILFVSCAHGDRQVSTEVAADIQRSAPAQVELDISSQDLAKWLKGIRATVVKNELSEQDIEEIERIHALYSTADTLAKSQKLRLQPKSRLKIDLPSFCLDPSGAVPSQKEPFLWKRGDPGITYYSRLIKLVSSDASLAQQDAQELIWNLRNRANYEDYPPRLRKVLDQIDSNAKLLLPSRTRNALQDAAGEVLRDAVPEIGIAEEAFSLIEGRYYSYSEVADRLRRRTHPEGKSSQDTDFFRLDSKPGVYASVQSSGFSEQKVVFFNTNGAAVDVDLSEFFLKPISSGVQRIGLSTQAGLGRSVRSAVEAALKDAIIRNSAYWYTGRLTPAETDFIENHPIEALNAYAQSRRAILSTWKHFVWAGLLTQQLGNNLAREFLSAHEQVTSNAKQTDRMSSEMDQWNNAEGVKSAKVLSEKGELSIGQLEKEAHEAITQGRLRVLQSQGAGLIYPVGQ